MYATVAVINKSKETEDLTVTVNKKSRVDGTGAGTSATIVHQMAAREAGDARYSGRLR